MNAIQTSSLDIGRVAATMTIGAPTSYPGVTPPPSGVVPDMENPKDAGRTHLLVWLVICNSLVFVFFVTRTYSKVWITRRIFLEDGMIKRLAS